MEDASFEVAFNELIRAERMKTPYYLVNIDKERKAFNRDFNQYYAEISYAAVPDISAFFDKEREDSEADEDSLFVSDLVLDLSDEVQRLLEKYPVLADGEMHITGKGIFLSGKDTDEQVKVCLIEGGSMIGTVKGYGISPVIPAHAYEQLRSANTYLDNDDILDQAQLPGIWLQMSDVSLLDPEGNEVEVLQETLVPVEFPSLVFSKVERQGLSQIRNQTEQSESVSELYNQLAGESILEFFQDSENDLNHNQYDPDVLRQLIDEYHKEFELLMSSVDQAQPLLLNARNVRIMTKPPVDLSRQKAYYCEPVFTKIDDRWRIVHGFMIHLDNKITFVHILPEDLGEITAA